MKRVLSLLFFAVTLAALAAADPAAARTPVNPRSLQGRERAWYRFLRTAFERDGRRGRIALWRVTERDSARVGGCLFASDVEYLRPALGDSALRSDVPVDLYRAAGISLRDSAGRRLWDQRYQWHSMVPFRARLLAAAPGGAAAVIAVSDTTAQQAMSGQEPEAVLALDRSGRQLLRIFPYCTLAAARFTADGAYAALLDACEWPRWHIVDVKGRRHLEMIGEDVLDVAGDGVVSYYWYEVPRDPKTRRLLKAPFDSLLATYKPHPLPPGCE